MLAAAYAVHDRHRGAATEGRRRGGGVGHGGRPGVDVGGGGRVVAVEDLGGEVAGGAEQPPGVGELGVVGHPGQPEVDQDRGAALHQHVGRLDVAVQHPHRVHRRQALGQAGREPQQVVPLDRTVLDDVVVQREAGHVAGGDVRDRCPRVGVDDLGDPLAPDPAQRADLAREPGPRLVVTDDVRTQDLQRDPLSPGPAGQVDQAHAALADLGHQRVVADGRHGVPGGRGTLGQGRAGHRPRLAVRRADSGVPEVRRCGASSRTCPRRGRTARRPGPDAASSSGRWTPGPAPHRRPTSGRRPG